MVFLGIVVAAAAVAAGIGLITANSSSASLSIFGRHVPGVHTEAEVLIGGMAVATVVIAGLALSVTSLRRSVRTRREFNDLSEEREESMSMLARKNQQLQQELARARSGAHGAQATTEVPVYPRARS